MKKNIFLLIFCLCTLGLYAQRIVPLSFSYDGGITFNESLKAVKIGEYLWLNQNVTDPSFAAEAITKAQIDLAHERYVMFDYNRPPNQPNKRIEPTYWSYGVTLEEFNKYYGTYFPRSTLQDYRNDEKTFAKEGNDSIPVAWKLPEENDVLQLIAMCGNATKNEVRQYLSWDFTDPTAPTFVKNIPPVSYYWWFYHNPALMGPDSNGFNVSNTNKYGFNWIPNGTSRYHADGAVLNTVNYEQDTSFVCKAGEFNGLNQVASIALGGISSLSLNDIIEIKYRVTWEKQTIRFCRPMTNEELGYKIYINQDMTGIDIATDPDESSALTTRFKSGEENLLAKVRTGMINANSIKIVKLPIGEYPPDGYEELPRGYIRGFYVQYILNNPNSKTVTEIINIALRNKNLWINADKVEGIPSKPKIIPIKYTENNGQTFYNYEAVRIGEYLWMNNNFYTPVMDMPTRAQFDDMLTRSDIDHGRYPMKMEVFNRYFGQYYDRNYIERMAAAGKIQEGLAGYTDWRLPYQRDFEQLFAMCGNATTNEIRNYLGCKVGENAAALWGDWYDGNINKYGFNMMPGGARVHALTSGLPSGSFYDMFELSRFAAAGGVTVSVQNGQPLFSGKLWHWLNMRFCRRLSDKELGYKLYINAKDYNPQTGQYASLDPEEVDIIKLEAASVAPSGYSELPNGYLRGFYVQRILESTVTFITSSDLAQSVNASTAMVIYPNPVTDMLYFNTDSQIQSFNIYSSDGDSKLVGKGDVKSINVSQLPNGVYYINIKTDKESYSQKFIKK